MARANLLPGSDSREPGCEVSVCIDASVPTCSNTLQLQHSKYPLGDSRCYATPRISQPDHILFGFLFIDVDINK
jgi:hypothetical protein